MAVIAAILLSVGGCGTGARLVPWSGAAGGTLQVRSLNEEPRLLAGRFNTAVYADRAVEASFFLCDRAIEEYLQGDMHDGQVVHVELLWTPRAGVTPIEDTAINASIRYIIFAEGEVGVYAGAGFARLRGEPGNEKFGLSIRDASLRLVDSTPGFNDLLTPAQLAGSFGARLDNHMASQLQHAVSQRVTNALGRSRIVNADFPFVERCTFLLDARVASRD